MHSFIYIYICIKGLTLYLNVSWTAVTVSDDVPILLPTWLDKISLTGREGTCLYVHNSRKTQSNIIMYTHRAIVTYAAVY